MTGRIKSTYVEKILLKCHFVPDHRRENQRDDQFPRNVCTVGKSGVLWGAFFLSRDFQLCEVYLNTFIEHSHT
jgi:hypothetical protein